MIGDVTGGADDLLRQHEEHVVRDELGKHMELTMKRAIILLFPILGFADISGVRVAGTTATQAILAYTAPGNGACTVAVSASPTYTPLAHDVDPALFSGANSDSRPGNINSGRSRVFVVGKRLVEKDLTGNNSSRALQAATLHYFRITCPSDGSSAAGTFTTQTIPGGVGYSDPIPIDPANNGNYLYPTFSGTDRTSSAIDPHTGALVRNLTLPGDIQGGGGAGMTSSGFGVMCHPTPVKASDEEKYGYHCQLSVGGVLGLYWIAPDGETRFLGVMRTSYSSPGWNVQMCSGAVSAPFDADDPNTFYCTVVGNTAPNNTLIILKAVYSGHSVPGQDADLTNQPSFQCCSGMPHSTYTQIMPWGRDLVTLLSEFDPKYVTYGIPLLGYFRGGDWANGKYSFYSWGATQDTFGWVAQYDSKQTAAMQQVKFGSAAGCVDNPAVTGSKYTGQAGCIVASTGTFTGGAGSRLRWFVLHAVNSTPASSFLGVAMNPLRLKTSLSYQVRLTTALSGTPASCTMPKPAGSTITDWPGSSWAYGCSTITVGGNPALVGTQAGYPASMPAEPGDMLSVDSANYLRYEAIRLLDKGPDGNTWYVQRRYFYGASAAYSSVPTGGALDMMAPNFPYAAWWDPNNGALSTDGTNTYNELLYPNHVAFLSHPVYGRWTYVAGGQAQSGYEPARLLNPPPVIQMNSPLFNGIGGSALESHPSLSVSNPPDADTFSQVVDNRPYYGDSGLVTESNVSAMGGQLYRIRGTNIAGNYKRIPYFANSGSRAMKEVSGAAVRLAADSSAQFQWCVALKAGECYSGSQPGDIYFNAPNIANAYCTYNWSTLQTTSAIPNDICVSASNAVTQAVVMQEIANDPFGLQLRVISNSLGQYDQESNFWNSRTIPDGSWLFTDLAAGSGTLKLIKIPPRQRDSVNRTTYVPISVSLPAVPGVDNAIVEFGYGENGDPGSFYCTARQEACVAQSATIDASQPFYFATTEAASITGMRCGSGCTVTIPGMPGKVVYYAVVSRDSSGKVVGQQSGAQAVP
jgi:hypothetical protein